MKKVTLYTDGACSGNPGNGGWGCVLMYNGFKREMSGFEAETTNNRMELTAVIMGLKAIKEPCEVDVYSDSQYVIDAFKKNWLTSWIKNGWKTSTKSPVKNIDLWQILIDEAARHRVTWMKVKGHSDNEFNNRCDELARKAIKDN